MLGFEFGQSQMNAFFVLIAIVIVAMTFLRISRRNRHYRASRDPSPTPAPPRIARVGEARSTAGAVAELDQAMVQIQELTREIEARLDTRVRHAKRLLDESESVIARLEQTLVRVRGATMAEGVAVAARALSPAASDGSAAQRGVHVDVVSAPATESPQPLAPSAVGEQIQRLAGEGMTAQEISARVRVPVGEVELHLALKRTARTR